MIDGSEKRNRQLAFELQNAHLFENCIKEVAKTDQSFARFSQKFPDISSHYFLGFHSRKLISLILFLGPVLSPPPDQLVT